MNIYMRGTALSLAAVLAIGPMVVNAENSNDATTIIPISAPIEEAVDERVMVSEYIEFRGKIEEIHEENGQLYILATNEITEGGLNALKAYIDKDVILLNNKDMDFAEKEDLEVGTEIVIFYHKDTIMAMSYPPMLSPDVLVINENEEQQVMVSKFDDELLNAEKDMFIRVSEETPIVDIEGNKVHMDNIKNKDLIVFYNIVLTSYPGQTGPQKVVLMPEREDQVVVEEGFILKSELIKNSNGVTMIPLRHVSEALGYEVTWEQETNSVELTKGAQWTQITIGENRYSFAKMIVRLDAAPELMDSSTYVPLGFVEQVLQSSVEKLENGDLRIIN